MATIQLEAEQRRTAPPPRRRGPTGNRAAGIFLAPFAVLFVVFFLVPIAYAVNESFYQVKRSGLGFGTPERVFAGLDNFTAVFADGSFMNGIGRLLLFGLVQVPIMLGLALVLALLLDSASARFKRVFRLTYFLPYAVPGVIAAIVWSFLYTPRISPLADLVPFDFLSDSVVLWSMANIVTWTWVGFNMLVIYAALQSIPTSLYEAAELDGAGGWKTAWYVKVPLVRPSLVLTGVFSIIGTLQLFNEPMVLSRITPAVGKDYTPLMRSLQVALDNNDYGQGTAIALMLAVFAAGLSYLFIRLSAWLTARGVNP
ncbi:carbohydrate ABC transporter permease [Nonomuraea dietziae]|uniref:Multiple sugar transport system permease protein n=1 Tax=Nonomuraea dietziae TaxID=65515 RepID=A0A7W5VHT2_9ACTN|nr:sugar ABC transporter permease [Nonomuraea dietziae]MBB3732268.1 multiple sugar transport system permease protein [Nonomuraea dietziae]